MIRLVPWALLFLIILPTMVEAQEPVTTITVHSQYTSIAVGLSQSDFNLDLTIRNGGDETAIVDIQVLSGPFAWNPNVYSKFKKVEVRRVELRPGEETEDLAFRFLVPDFVEDGDYTFRMGFFDEENRTLDELEYHVSVGRPKEQEEQLVQGGYRPLGTSLHRPYRP